MVPELAVTGTVTVLGSGASLPLQIVPVLRSAGGTIAAGNTIVLEATGLALGQLTLTIDGHAATGISLRDTVDINQFGVGGPIPGQQLVTLTVPAGVSAGVITITTPGGSTTLRTGVTIAAQPGFVSPATDTDDTLATANAITLPADATISISGTAGDGANGTKDVDLYKITLGSGELLSAVLNGNLYAQLRIFNAAGQEVATQNGPYVSPNTTGIIGQFVAPVAGTYFVGVTGYNNLTYDPKVAASGTAASYSGPYTLTLTRLVAGGTQLTGIGTTATSGTPAVSGVASANVGQTITLNGTGLISSDQIVFTGIDDSGNLTAITVSPATVAPNGTSLTVVVPLQATTGTVRLAREPNGILLQVVPILTHVGSNTGGAYSGSDETLNGSGFAEGLTTVNIGSARLVDSSRDSSSVDVFSQGQTLDFTVPDRVEGGPVSVTTPGGTSAIYALSFTGITSTAQSGTAAIGGQAAANRGQTITITGTGLDLTTDVVFRTVDDSGNKGQVVVHPATAAADGTSATVVVPGNAVTDVVRVVGDHTGDDVPLQIVPTITGMTVNSVASDGSSAFITLHGTGLVDGNNSSYQIGSTIIADASSANQGPDVYSTGTNVDLTVPLFAGSFGPITVTTAGGTSTQLTAALTLTVANATATSGTPANPALPSANPGQTITLTGTALSTGTGVIMSYTDNGGTVRTILLTPTTAAADGTSATFAVPSYANGVTKLSILGASTSVTLQIVPVVTSAHVNGTNAIQFFGTGFQEGSAGNTVSYNFAGASVTDTAANTGPDVSNNVSGSDNTFVNIAEPAHGFGTISVKTAGGTSASIALNDMGTGVGFLRDIAMNPANPGQVWAMDNANPATLHLLNTATGADIRDIALTASFGSTSFFGGLQVAPAAFSLDNIAVPQGSLLLFDGETNPDRIVAVDPATGGIIATLVLTKNYDLTAGVYDPVSGHIYIIDRSIGTNQIVALDPATGAEIASSRFNLPFNAGEAGLALNQAGDGTFWYGSDQSNSVVHLSASGTVLKTDDLTAQGVSNDEINGLSFDNNGNLLVGSKFGVIYRVTV